MGNETFLLSLGQKDWGPDMHGLEGQEGLRVGAELVPTPGSSLGLPGSEDHVPLSDLFCQLCRPCWVCCFVITKALGQNLMLAGL